MKNNSTITLRLILLNFLEFAVWGAYLTSLGRYLGGIGMGSQIKWFFAMQGIVSIFMPTLMGIVADRKIQAQKVLSLCHGLAGIFMLAAGIYCMQASVIAFAPLFVLYSLSVAFFMPSIALVNSVAYNALEKAGKDPVKDFPPIRVFGTIGFIASMLLTNFLSINGVRMQDSYTQLISSGLLSLLLCAYALSMPECPTKKGEKSASLADYKRLREHLPQFLRREPCFCKHLRREELQCPDFHQPDFRDPLHTAHSVLYEQVRHKEGNAHRHVRLGVPLRLLRTRQP